MSFMFTFLALTEKCLVTHSRHARMFMKEMLRSNTVTFLLPSFLKLDKTNRQNLSFISYHNPTYSHLRAGQFQFDFPMFRGMERRVRPYIAHLYNYMAIGWSLLRRASMRLFTLVAKGFLLHIWTYAFRLQKSEVVTLRLIIFSQ